MSLLSVLFGVYVELRREVVPRILAGPGGFEPPTTGLGGQRSVLAELRAQVASDFVVLSCCGVLKFSAGCCLVSSCSCPWFSFTCLCKCFPCFMGKIFIGVYCLVQ